MKQQVNSLNPSSPQSQMAGDRPISFYLVDRTGQNVFYPMYLRPEDLTRTDPSRITTQQTLGSEVWSDSFGPGLPTINISGHTGWRRTSPLASPSYADGDGMERFSKLKTAVFDQWHSGRRRAAEQGRNPSSTVQLIFSDKLDSFTSVVAPLSFTLRRSRQRPLLMQFQISMAVLSDNIADVDVPKLDPAVTKPNSVATQSAGLDSLLTSIDTITTQAAKAKNYIDKSIAAPVAAFMVQTAGVFNRVQEAVNSTVGVTESMIGVARLAAQSGVNIFRSLAAVAGVPSLVKASLMEVAGAYTNSFCVLRNVFGRQLLYADYSPLYGSSNCSSTSGGRPPSALAGVNPFNYVLPPVETQTVSTTPVAQNTLKAAAAIDPVLAPPSTARIGQLAELISSGITLS